MTELELNRRVEKLTSILHVARAMTEERELDKLLNLVVDSVKAVVDSDRTSIFIYDRDRDELWSRVAEGTGEIRFSARTGIAGSVVKTGQVSNIPDAYANPLFNKQIDLQTGFRTRSMLTVPMKNTSGEIVGALQTLNKSSPDGKPLTFTTEDEELLLALASVAASAVVNALLHEEIEQLFEGFAKASVVAIESRDPTTAGHSGRVAQVTLGLAQVVDTASVGRWKDVKFSREQLQELRYAALLHDFGKVGVRENVLVKAKKLYPEDLAALEQRFEMIRQSIQAEHNGRKLDIAMAGGNERDIKLAEEQKRLEARLMELDGLMEFVHAANQPTVMPGGSFERIAEIATRRYQDSRGNTLPYLTEREVAFLSIPRGTLSISERQEIESHVTHTYNFLSQIPWTRSLRKVPDIAYGHHEKLTGHGYPRSLAASEIPVQTRMMTIADIYDALTASDRPYKRAIPHEKAIDILHLEVKDGNVDADLLKIFVEADVPHHVKPF